MSNDLLQGIPLLRLERCDYQKTGLTQCAWLGPEMLRDAAKLLLDKEYFLEDLSVLETTEGFIAVYHFDHFSTPGRIALRVVTSRNEPELPSIADIYHGAAWHERESHDFFGVSFAGNGNLSPLLLPGDAQFHPLRKQDKDLKPVIDLIDPGEVVHEAPEFTLYAPPSEIAPEQEIQPDEEQPAAETAPES